LKVLGLIVVIATGLILMYAVGDFPGWGDPQSPANAHVSTYYLENSLKDTNVPNVITSVLADYRGFDTMFETCVIFVAGVAIIAMLRRSRRKEDQILRKEHDSSVPSSSIIIQTICRIMIPFMQLFALYVVAHGHHSPGGGFQGGVILGASLILLAIAYDLQKALKKITENMTIIVATLGLLVYSGIGVVAVLLGGNYLDYSAWHILLPATDEIMARSHGMLGVEIGVALTVTAIMFSIYKDLASHGRLDRGL
jgi:multicomponent Na+:H+ antiporter subunit B